MPVELQCPRCSETFRVSPSQAKRRRYCSMKCRREPVNADSAEYKSWWHMHRRCSIKSSHDYVRYGARGIRVCDRWSTFHAFLADMGTRPTTKHTLERTDNDGNYEPGNCRWATRREQCNNTRRNRWIEHDGMMMTIAQWERRMGYPQSLIKTRLLRGWTVARAIDETPRSNP